MSTSVGNTPLPDVSDAASLTPDVSSAASSGGTTDGSALPSGGGWTPVCPLRRLQPERGVCALVAGEPVAVFRTRDDRLFALHNVDPFSGASVLSRGILGDLGGVPVVASPLYKQHFALESGAAVEDDSVVVATYPVRVVDGTVEVGSA